MAYLIKLFLILLLFLLFIFFIIIFLFPDILNKFFKNNGNEGDIKIKFKGKADNNINKTNQTSEYTDFEDVSD